MQHLPAGCATGQAEGACKQRRPSSTCAPCTVHPTQALHDHTPAMPPPPRLAAHAYYRTLPFSIAQYRFGAAEGPAAEGHQPFVSAVCWANRSRHCLAANSQGLLQILKLE